MPFKSEAQRRYMFLKHPEIAKKWTKESKNQKKLPMHKGERKFVSRSVHGSGAFTDEDICKGYRCEPTMGS